jgi:hypothetical protein
MKAATKILTGCILIFASAAAAQPGGFPIHRTYGVYRIGPSAVAPDAVPAKSATHAECPYAAARRAAALKLCCAVRGNAK